MELEAKLLAADAVGSAGPVVAATACITPTNVAENPIHAVHRTFGVALYIVFVVVSTVILTTHICTPVWLG
jgi:hypothetical protein